MCPWHLEIFAQFAHPVSRVGSHTVFSFFSLSADLPKSVLDCLSHMIRSRVCSALCIGKSTKFVRLRLSRQSLKMLVSGLFMLSMWMLKLPIKISSPLSLTMFVSSISENSPQKLMTMVEGYLYRTYRLSLHCFEISAVKSWYSYVDLMLALWFIWKWSL